MTEEFHIGKNRPTFISKVKVLYEIWCLSKFGRLNVHFGHSVSIRALVTGLKGFTASARHLSKSYVLYK